MIQFVDPEDGSASVPVKVEHRRGKLHHEHEQTNTFMLMLRKAGRISVGQSAVEELRELDHFLLVALPRSFLAERRA
jgi:hypothetical protein